MKGSLDRIAGAGIDSMLLDLSSLVGREIIIYSDQYPGRPLNTRVVMVNGNALSIDRSGSSGLIGQLINNQKISAQFEYQGEMVSVHAKLNKSVNGTCTLTLSDKIVPLTRRRFTRFEADREARLAVVNIKTFEPGQICRLRWIKTNTVNVSCGGALVNLSSLLRKHTYLFVHIAMIDFQLPQLLVAQVRHSKQKQDGGFKIGLEFIVNEEKAMHFTSLILKNLPSAVLEYSIPLRSEVNRELNARMREYKE